MIPEKTVLKLLERKKKFFSTDYQKKEKEIKRSIKNSRIVVIGGAGSIGFSVVKLLISYNPKLIHIIDINENKLVEVVRYIRSSIGYIEGKIETFSLDVGSKNFESLVKRNKGYDIWLNFSALKHVRSERDPFTLMRMIEVNFENTLKMLNLAKKTKAKKFFSVSSDKACDPVNFLGATKRLMELALSCYSKDMLTCSARFGNVAFSDGSLLYGALQRINNGQPLVAPIDIKRYFLTHEEASKLSLIATFCSKTGEIFIPKIKKSDAQKDFPKNLTPLQPEEVQFIEKEIDLLTDRLPPLKNFVIPGGHILVSYTHLARSVCRRAERYVTELDHQAPVSATLIAYINRLSDYFFTLSRIFVLDLEIEEVKWNGN